MNIEEIIADHHAPVYRYAFRLTGKVADAEDLTQQTFLIAQQKLHQLRDATRARGWLFAVLRSCFLRECRKRNPTPAAALELSVDEIPDSVTDERFTLDSEELQAAINELAEEFRVVVLLFYFEQKSYKQIAADLDVPIGTVMSRLARAKGRLRQQLLAVSGEHAGGQENRQPTKRGKEDLPGSYFHSRRVDNSSSPLSDSV